MNFSPNFGPLFFLTSKRQVFLILSSCKMLEWSSSLTALVLYPIRPHLFLQPPNWKTEAKSAWMMAIRGAWRTDIGTASSSFTQWKGLSLVFSWMMMMQQWYFDGEIKWIFSTTMIFRSKMIWSVRDKFNLKCHINFWIENIEPLDIKHILLVCFKYIEVCFMIHAAIHSLL